MPSCRPHWRLAVFQLGILNLLAVDPGAVDGTQVADPVVAAFAALDDQVVWVHFRIQQNDPVVEGAPEVPGAVPECQVPCP